MSRRRARLIVATALAAALVLAACGKTDDDSSGTTTTAAGASTTTKATTTTEATTTTGGAADAEARAKSVDLDASVLGVGWTGVPHEEDSASDDPLTKCNPDASDKSDELASFNTDDFQKGSLDGADGAQITVETKVFVDEAAAKKQVSVFSDDAIISCVDKAFKGAFDGATVTGQLKESALTTDADESKVLSGTYTISSPAGDQTVDLALIFVVLRTGDVASAVTGVAIGPEAGKDGDAIQSVVDEVVKLQAEA